MVTVGIDEVGRGCWAGPLVAGAVILASDYRAEDCPVRLRDSKKLTKLQREQASASIKEYAVAIGLGWVGPGEVDAIGITKSVQLAMRRALSEIADVYDEIVVDGNINYFPDDPRARQLVKADDLIPSVSAASIVAKVARDAYMHEIARKYAGYGFDKHVGYGTPFHIAALQKLGVSDIHRTSYKPVRLLLA